VAGNPSSVERLRAAMAVTRGAPFFRFETGWDALERWRREEGLREDADLNALFHLDEDGFRVLGGLYPLEALLCPAFEPAVLEDRGRYRLAQDAAGRVLMVGEGEDRTVPEYVDFPVRSRRTWEDNVRWRLAPDAPGRAAGDDDADASGSNSAGPVRRLDIIGGYPFLCGLVGAGKVPYFLYDEADLVREMMEAWLTLADAVASGHQQSGALEEIVLREDICFGQGPLLSPAMIREFLLPYYEQLFSAVKRRQAGRPVRIHLDSDGDVRPVLPLYQGVGVNSVGPLEVAAGCDPVAIGEQYPDWVLWGGIDHRLLTCPTDAMDAELARILPVMKGRGGYIPHIDRPVPAGVPLANYLHYRRRCEEMGT
jgi:hypothetical protein